MNSSYKRQKELEKEVRAIPGVTNELIELIHEFEAKYGEIVLNGTRAIDKFKQEEVKRTRTVGLIGFCYV